MDLIDAGLYLIYVLLGVGVLSSLIVFPVVRAVESPKSFLTSLYFLGAMIVLFFISYALSSDEVKPTQVVLGVTPTISKLISAGLITFYITLILAVIGLIYSEINKALN